MNCKPMKKPKAVQPNLFAPQRLRPAWRDLPKDVREEVVGHLAAILRDHAAGRTVPEEEDNE